MITEIYKFWVFWSKNGRFVTHICFPKKKERPWNPYFYSVFWVRVFWAKVSKKGNFEKPSKKGKLWLIIEKLFFGVFAVFWVFFLLVFFFGCFLLGGFKGQVRWPKGPPHLALNPPFFFCFCFLFFVLFFVFFGGFKGQVRWPKGPPHLDLNPPYLFLLFLLFCFFLGFWFFGCSLQKKTLFFPQKRAFFVYFQCFSFFLP